MHQNGDAALGARLLLRVRVVRLQLRNALEVRLRGICVAAPLVRLGTPEKRLQRHIVGAPAYAHVSTRTL